MCVSCRKKQLLTEKEYRDLREKYEDDFQASMGAEAIKTLLEEIDLEQESTSSKMSWRRPPVRSVSVF